MSLYTLILTESSFCQHCSQPLTFLTSTTATRIPTFYICFDCKKVFEVGVGEVKLYSEEAEAENV